MALKDIGKGWGNLNGALLEWHCPICIDNYHIVDWSIVYKELGGINCDGRKCPKCDFSAYQWNESNLMDPFERENAGTIKAKKIKIKKETI